MTYSCDTSSARSRSAAPFSRSVPPTAAQRVPDKVICSLFESGKVDVVVGLCFINLGSGTVTLSTILDTQTYVRTFHKLHVFEPSEVVLPLNYMGPSTNKLVTILRSNVSADTKISGIDKRYYKSSSGMEELARYCFEQDVGNMQRSLKDEDYALAAFAGGIHYMRTKSDQGQAINYRNFKVKYETSESIMFMDTNTIKSLQLSENSEDKKGLSLLKFMNNTVTKMGERTLRSNILQPLTDKDSIQERLKAVQELKDHIDLIGDLRFELRNCQDLDKLLTILLTSKTKLTSANESQKINDILMVKQAVSVSLAVSNLLQTATAPLLQEVREICGHESIEQIKGLIYESINEDCTWASGSLDLKNQRCYAVKAGRNGLLDVSRQVYKVVVDEVVTIISSLAEEHEMELEQSYNSKRGFYIKIMDHKNNEEIPDIFINRSVKKKFIECTTLDIIKCNARLDDTVDEILTISNQVIESVIDEITFFLPVLFMVVESLSILDILQCFAYNANQHDYKCPEFSDCLTLKSSRHPVLETLVTPFIPNDICCIQDISRFQVISGTNMSGKSVYLRQVALLSIMAQTGSFVPADCAIFKIFESLRARVCVDSGSMKTSTFSQEMIEMACILESVNEKTLVIIDELGRGSSINDAFSICLAICEYLVSSRATVFTTTHFHELSAILGTKSGVIQNHMETVILESGTNIEMRYKLRSGLTEGKQYGIQMSKRFFSSDIIARAEEISQVMQEGTRMRKEEQNQLKKEKRYFNLVEVLKYVVNGEEFSVDLLKSIQDQFFGDA